MTINPTIRTATPRPLSTGPALAAWLLVRDSDPQRAIVERGGYLALFAEVIGPAISRGVTEVIERFPLTRPGELARLGHLLRDDAWWGAVAELLVQHPAVRYVAYVAHPLTLGGNEDAWRRVIERAGALGITLAFDAAVGMAPRERAWVMDAAARGLVHSLEPWWDGIASPEWSLPVIVAQQHLDQLGADYTGKGWPANWRRFADRGLPRRTLILRDEPLTQVAIVSARTWGWTPAVYPHRLTVQVRDLPL